jgi:hypothetical protein
MGWRGTVVLVLLVLAVGIYVWTEEPPAQPADNSTLLGEPRHVDPDKLVPLLDFTPEEVLLVRLRRDGESREARRDDGAWSGSTKAGAVDDFLVNLASLARILDVPGSENDLQQYGLQKPHASIELHLRNRESPLVLEIGDSNPAATGVYTRIDRQGTVILAGALLSWEFDKTFGALAPERD